MNMGLGQMKFDAPPRYGGGRLPGVRVWLGLMKCYMQLTNCPPKDWLDIVAMRVEGAASAWLNAVLVSIERGRQLHFLDWDNFKTTMIATFEPLTELKEARKALQALCQMSKASNYIQKFQEL